MGLSGADIDETLNRAALIAARSQAAEITNSMLAAACDEVYWGAANDSMHMKEESRWTTAIHEAGHAIVAWGYGLEVPRLTVRPRRHALGMTQWQREEGCFNANRSGHLGQMALSMGGLAAENLVFGHYGMGGIGDLRHVQRNIMALCAAGQEGLGLAVVSNDPGHWSEHLRQKAEGHAQDLIEQAMKMAEDCLSRQKDDLVAFATFLIEHRELSGPLLDPWSQKFQGRGEFPELLPPPSIRSTAAGATVHTQGQGADVHGGLGADDTSPA